MVEVAPVSYRPHDERYRLDVEIVDAAELRARVAANPRRGFERVDFQCVLHVIDGHYDHVVDFERHELSAGSCLVIAPGQVHRFGPPSDWRGWMLIVDAHLVPATAPALPDHVRLTGSAADAVTELFTRMEADASSNADRRQVDRLLELQTATLVERLALGAPTNETDRFVDDALLARYRDFRDAVDRSFGQWHLVGTYARELGCSAKSINRACRAAADLSAKQVIAARIVLEAKRMLAHGDQPVSTIGRRLGFAEATNFVKFFRRETATTPAAFRTDLRAHRDESPRHRGAEPSERDRPPRPARAATGQ